QSLRRALRWVKIALSPRLITYMGLEGARFQNRPGRCVVATSDSLGAEVRAAYPQVASRLSVIPPGVEMPGPGPGRAEARALLGLPAEGRLVLFVGNDYERKGLGTLLAAMAELPADVRLAVAGKERYIPQFQDAVKLLGLGQRVHFLGSLKSMDCAYRAADCLAHPTREDSFAMVVLEAMGHGLPVVVSGPAHCGIAALLSDGQHAVLLQDPRDATQLASALLRVLGDQALSAHLGAHARAFAMARGWGTVARQYEALYRSCVKLKQQA
ncbi:MAG: glycosyltransferase family 4 protein, partial [Burkholderiaceae bacterium]|nr:glycosyltransferase family 4 protein [Burkholderiaceae bacterium]